MSKSHTDYSYDNTCSTVTIASPRVIRRISDVKEYTSDSYGTPGERQGTHAYDKTDNCWSAR